MHTPQPKSETGSLLVSESPQKITGVVQRVDLVNRELELTVSNRPCVFDVPVDCLIVLHGERIKLRLVQPKDRVAITYVRRPNSLCVRRLDEQPGWPPPAAA